MSEHKRKAGSSATEAYEHTSPYKHTKGSPISRNAWSLVQCLKKEMQDAQGTTKTDVWPGVRGHAFLQIKWEFGIPIKTPELKTLVGEKAKIDNRVVIFVLHIIYCIHTTRRLLFQHLGFSHQSEPLLVDWTWVRCFKHRTIPCWWNQSSEASPGGSQTPALASETKINHY